MLTAMINWSNSYWSTSLVGAIILFFGVGYFGLTASGGRVRRNSLARQPLIWPALAVYKVVNGRRKSPQDATLVLGMVLVMAIVMDLIVFLGTVGSVIDWSEANLLAENDSAMLAILPALALPIFGLVFVVVFAAATELGRFYKRHVIRKCLSEKRSSSSGRHQPAARP